ncbi:hypothetical protein HMPREF1869_01755 [Bacteroidales bacterium KA00251]|nr:hypothetical protein HMPREF1869_01755 [Bacteroidales bacterium KA00251]
MEVAVEGFVMLATTKKIAKTLFFGIRIYSFAWKSLLELVYPYPCYSAFAHSLKRKC